MRKLYVSVIRLELLLPGLIKISFIQLPAVNDTDNQRENCSDILYRINILHCFPGLKSARRACAMQQQDVDVSKLKILAVIEIRNPKSGVPSSRTWNIRKSRALFFPPSPPRPRPRILRTFSAAGFRYVELRTKRIDAVRDVCCSFGIYKSKWLYLNLRYSAFGIFRRLPPGRPTGPCR